MTHRCRAFTIPLFVLIAAACSAAERPNVLFVISDDLGAQSLGCYGNEQCRTPHIDRMAREGRKFTSFYVSSGVCTPSPPFSAC